MATCSSFQEIFEKPLPENPTLIESLASSWKKIKAKQQAELCSYTELFGELHFKENLDSSSSSSLAPPSLSMDVILHPENEKLNDQNNNENKIEIKKESSLNSLLCTPKNQYSSSANNGKNGFSSKKIENLKLCTEGLGFESSDEVENSKNTDDDWKENGKEVVSIKNDSSSDNLSEMGNTKYPSSDDLRKGSITKHSLSSNLSEYRKTKSLGRNFPPPISCIGKNGKPCVCLKSFRYSGRFVLKEIKIPTKEVLHASREDGRLTLHLVLPDDDEIPEEDGEGEEFEEELEEEEELEVENNDAEEQEDGEKKDEFCKDELEGNQ